jgi:hypothetical protein
VKERNRDLKDIILEWVFMQWDKVTWTWYI